MPQARTGDLSEVQLHRTAAVRNVSSAASRPICVLAGREKAADHRGISSDFARRLPAFFKRSETDISL